MQALKLRFAGQEHKQHQGQINPQHPHRVSRGLGRCSKCSCPGFKGNGNICEDCGHHYDEHNTSPF